MEVAADLLRRSREQLAEVAGLSSEVDAGLAGLAELQDVLSDLLRAARRATESRERNGGTGPEAPPVRTCPGCGHPMVPRTRTADGDPFWGCSQFPGCRRTAAMSVAEARRAGVRG